MVDLGPPPLIFPSIRFVQPPPSSPSTPGDDKSLGPLQAVVVAEAALSAALLLELLMAPIVVEEDRICIPAVLEWYPVELEVVDVT